MEKSLQIAGDSLILRDMNASHMEDILTLHRRIFSSDVQQDWFAWKYEGGHGDSLRIPPGNQLEALKGDRRACRFVAGSGLVPRGFARHGAGAAKPACFGPAGP